MLAACVLVVWACLPLCKGFGVALLVWQVLPRTTVGVVSKRVILLVGNGILDDGALVWRPAWVRTVVREDSILATAIGKGALSADVGRC